MNNNSQEKPTDNDSGEEEDFVFSLAIYDGEDLNPFTSTHRANRNIISLCCNSLIYLDNNFNAVPDIADYVFNTNKVTFTIKKDITFSDGSQLVALDCVYSFYQAKRTNSIYSSRFDYISDFYALDSNTFVVEFKSNYSKSYYESNINLLDIPIVKNDSLSTQFIGTGRYTLVKEANGYFLYGRHDGRYSDDYELDLIRLHTISDVNDLTYDFNYAVIHAAYADLSYGNSRYKGNVEIVTFPTLDLYYLVVNRSKKYFNDINAVSAISYAVDRKKINDSVFDGLATVTWLPFHPLWSRISNVSINEDIYSSTKANSLLADAGISYKNSKRVFEKNVISLVIICNSEDIVKTRIAREVASQLNEIGFNTTVKSLSWSSYNNAILNGDFDIYIGESKIYSNMDISFMFDYKIMNNHLWDIGENKLITDTRKMVYGDYYYNLLSINNAFLLGSDNYLELVTEFSEKQPFIPIAFATGALAINRIINGDFSPTQNNLFFNIESWHSIFKEGK